MFTQRSLQFYEEKIGYVYGDGVCSRCTHSRARHGFYGACEFRSFNGRRTGLYIIFEDFGISAVLHLRYG